VTACAYCGRANDAGAQFCMDCGKPLAQASSVRAATAAPPTTRSFVPVGSTAIPAPGCPFCGGAIDGPLAFCPHCGRRLRAPGSGPSCARCGAPAVGSAQFCAVCGAPLSSTATEAPADGHGAGPLPLTLVLLTESGTEQERFDRDGPEVTVGKQNGDVHFPDDPFMSPLHARISRTLDQMLVRDLGSRNGTWVFLEAPHRLVDGDLMLIGSQMIRFRRLGYPGPHAPDADATKRMGSLTPSADIASLTQLRSDGSARDVIQLSPGRDVLIGRERGDWTFPYDPSMSATHASVRSEDADFVLIDANSRNGVAVAARGDVPVRHGSRILVGDKVLRVELPSA
jgi:pSer/pThr/pTyr-binding forkhead associated (FHA) protein/predicted amidophosphoribosyltransferase